jgi:methionyl-tRNA synthetase
MSEFKRYLVTSALPYANGPLHLGHLAGAYLPADLYCRYLRLKGHDVLYICGSDEHGVPILIRARNEGVSPQEVVDRFHAHIEDSFRRFGMSFDYYGRTSSPMHHRTSQEIFERLDEQGVFVLKTDRQLFDPEAGMFLADRFVRGTCPVCGYEDAYGDQCEKCGTSLSPAELIHPRSALTDAVPIEKESTHWYMPLAAWQKRLETWIESHPEWKSNVLGQIRSWFTDGLRDRAMTRDLTWGVDVPASAAARAGVDTLGKVLYVWFDAPIGYISATREWAERKGDPERWRTYWQSRDTKLVHFIGKDNIVFHALIWPAMLMAYGDYVLPAEIPANQFLNLEGEKLSTSKNYAIWLPDYLKEFEADSLRYVLCRNAPEDRDADFTWRDFQAWHNNELADILGNFVNRTLTFVSKYYGGTVPTASAFTEADNHVLEILHQAPNAIGDRIERFQFKSALQELIKIAQEGNRYFDHEEPWVTRKTNPLICERTTYVCMKIVNSLAVLSEPFIPFAAAKIKKMINFIDQRWDDIGVPKVAPTIGQPEILFKKIEDSVIEVQVAKLKKREVSIEEFGKIELRTAKVLSAQAVKGSNQLIQLQIEVGDHQKQIIAGVGKFYKPEELVGRVIVIVDNLKSAVIRGIKSEGMLLAAEDKNGNLTLVTTDKDSPSGSKVK